MKAWSLFAGVAVLLSCLVAAGLGVAPSENPGVRPGDSEPTTADLLERIEKLEQRVEELERRQPFVVAEPDVPFPPQPAPEWNRGRPSPSSPPGHLDPLPKGWTRKQFNGQYYYIVPLSSPSAPPAESVVPAPRASSSDTPDPYAPSFENPADASQVE